VIFILSPPLYIFHPFGKVRVFDGTVGAFLSTVKFASDVSLEIFPTKSVALISIE